MNEDPVVIIGASRTPMGGFGGDFAELSASELGSAAISDSISKAGIKADEVDDVGIKLFNVATYLPGRKPDQRH